MSQTRVMGASGATVQDTAFRFYDTLINPGNMPEALECFAHNLGAKESALILSESSYLDISKMCESTNISGVFQAVLSYNKDFYDQDHAAFSYVNQYPERCTWISDEEAFGVPRDKILSSQFINEDFGIKSRFAAALNKTPLWSDFMVLYFWDVRDTIPAACLEASDLLLTHVAKVIELSRPFRLLQERFNAVLSVLDKLRVGIVITTAAGQVVVSNARAQACHDMADGITIGKDKRLTLPDAASQGQYTQNVTAAAMAVDPGTFKSVMVVPRKSGKTPWILETFCLSEITGEIDGMFRGACTFIIDPDDRDSISAKGMGLAFGLTEAENQVCHLLTEGYKLGDIAEARNTTPETIRSQIKSMFQKTGCHSQTDLVRQTLRVNLPVQDVDKAEDANKSENALPPQADTGHKD